MAQGSSPPGTVLVEVVDAYNRAQAPVFLEVLKAVEIPTLSGVGASLLFALLLLLSLVYLRTRRRAAQG